MAPARATISTAVVKEADDIDEPTLRRTILKNVTAGKATPYTKVEVKMHGDFQVKVRCAENQSKTNLNISICFQVQNNFTTTPAGPICKVTGMYANKSPEWETYIGSPVVNFCLCSKYVLLCSKDCTVRFLDVRNGTAVLPILHMPSPVIQCVFVCETQ